MGKHAPPEKLLESLLEYDDAPLEGGYYDSSEVPAPVPERRAPPGSKFSPERCAAIIEDIRQGAFLHVAAAANGVTVATLNRWRRDPAPEFAEFAAALDRAQGRARVHAEHRVHAEKPAIWLRLGPGRDHGDPSKPGWTTPAKRIEGTHRHAHLHMADDRPRMQIPLDRLSRKELETLEATMRKLIPAGVAGGAIEVEARQLATGE